MTTFGVGLTGLTSDQLRKLLRAVHHGNVVCPLQISSLALIGLQDAAHLLLGHLRGLDEKAVRAVLVAVLAERKALEETPS